MNIIIATELKKQVDTMTQKRLLTWLILHRVSVEDDNYSLILSEVNRFSIFQKTNQSIVRNYLLSLEESKLVASSYYRKRKTFTIDKLESITYSLLEEGSLLVHSLSFHYKYLDSLHLSHSGNIPNYHQLPQIDIRFLGRILTVKKVFTYYILTLIQTYGDIRLAPLGIENLLTQSIGWSCSTKAIETYIVGLVEQEHVEIIEDEKGKRLILSKTGRSIFSTYKECAMMELREGKEVLQELICYIESYLLEHAT